MDLGQTYDVESMELDDELIPDGTRAIMQIVGEQERETANGRMLTFDFVILEGEYENRHVWENYNVENANEKTQDWARKDVARIARACGVSTYNDTTVMHEKPFEATICIQKGSNGYSDRNGIKSKSPSAIGGGGDAPPAPRDQSTARSTQNGGAAPTTAAPQRAASGGSKPWSRK